MIYKRPFFFGSLDTITTFIIRPHDLYCKTYRFQSWQEVRTRPCFGLLCRKDHDFEILNRGKFNEMFLTRSKRKSVYHSGRTWNLSLCTLLRKVMRTSTSSCRPECRFILLDLIKFNSGTSSALSESTHREDS